MMVSDSLDEALKIVRSRGPNYEIISRLGYELDMAYSRNRYLSEENRNLRRSYRRLKTWFNGRFKYYKAHRDELLNEKDHKMDSTVVCRKIEERPEESGSRFTGRSRTMVR